MPMHTTETLSCISGFRSRMRLSCINVYKNGSRHCVSISIRESRSIKASNSAHVLRIKVREDRRAQAVAWASYTCFNLYRMSSFALNKMLERFYFGGADVVYISIYSFHLVALTQPRNIVDDMIKWATHKQRTAMGQQEPKIKWKRNRRNRRWKKETDAHV